MASWSVKFIGGQEVDKAALVNREMMPLAQSLQSVLLNLALDFITMVQIVANGIVNPGWLEVGITFQDFVYRVTGFVKAGNQGYCDARASNNGTPASSARDAGDVWM